MKTMTVAGVMSGTSADGVDVALARIVTAEVTDAFPSIELVAHEHFPYPADVREAVLRVMEGGATTAAELSRLHWRLGQVYAECIDATAVKAGVRPDLVGCHGQTVYHQAAAKQYCGAPVRATWQIGEASAIAERMRVPVVSDFRPADLAAGGQGAPLVPMLDVCLFRSQTVNRVLLNLGGIANVTAIPAGAGIDDVIAFDTGPGNMAIDAAMQRLFGRPFDNGGEIGEQGKIVSSMVTEELGGAYFSVPPPKSCGREEFGAAFVDRLVEACGSVAEDVVATATALTARSIVDAYTRFCAGHLRGAERNAGILRFAQDDKSRGDGEQTTTEMIAAGGGTRNAFLMRLLREGLEPLGVTLMASDELGMPPEAKEAVAFALLAWLTWHRKPGNVVAATGASRAVVLGRVTHV